MLVSDRRKFLRNSTAAGAFTSGASRFIRTSGVGLRAHQRSVGCWQLAPSAAYCK